MKRGYLIVFLSFLLQAQHTDERVIGNLVNKLDRETMKKIKNPKDVEKKELIAAYYPLYATWFYAEVTNEPDCDFYGFASFVKDGPYCENGRINFKSDVRKLLTKEKLQEQQKKSKHHSCSVQ